MSISEIKNELHELIDHADDEQLKEFYGFFQIQQVDKTQTLDNLPQWQKESILQGLAEAEAGLGRPVDKLLKEIRQRNNGKF